MVVACTAGLNTILSLLHEGIWSSVHACEGHVWEHSLLYTSASSCHSDFMSSVSIKPAMYYCIYLHRFVHHQSVSSQTDRNSHMIHQCCCNPGGIHCIRCIHQYLSFATHQIKLCKYHKREAWSMHLMYLSINSPSHVSSTIL